MADKAHNAADVRLEKMEKRLAGIYHRAQKGIEEKATAYFEQFERLDAEKRKLVEAEKMTEEEYKQWRQNKMLYGKRYTDLKKQIAAEIAHVNETAYAYINEQLPELYAIGYDAFSDVADGIPGYSFTLVDADTVRHLATTDKSILPYKKLDRAKDIPWNMKRVNAEVLQGILQGESIPKIAARMQKVTGSNAEAAVRTARTAVTEAENRGRQDSYERARKDGVMLKRKWIATYDMRTRHAHALLDGQLAEVDEPFESELGPIMFPGDHTAHPSNVYNCRCTLGVKYLGFDGKKTKIKSEDNRPLASELVKGKTAKNVLTNGGNNGKMRISLQFFAEKDIERQESGSLKRALRKYREKINLHQQKILNPQDFVSDWESKDPREQAGLIRHWKKEINNFQTSIDDRVLELKKRGDYDD